MHQLEELADRYVEDKLQAYFLRLRAAMLVWSWVYMLLKNFLEEGHWSRRVAICRKWEQGSFAQTTLDS